MSDARIPEDWPELEALKTIEKVVWRNGIEGDACARIAATIVQSLVEAGYVLVRKTDVNGD